MDLSKLKNRPSYPFETIAVAVSFSEHCQPLLIEAQRLALAFGAHLVLIHVGEKNPEKQNELDNMLGIAGIDDRRSRIIWMEGEPVDTILKLCKLNMVDLLILGALQKENLFKFYLGSIARNICRKAKCSLLLLVNPQMQVVQFKRLVVNGVDNPKTIHTVNTSVYFCKTLSIPELYIANEIDLPGLAMVVADNSTAPETRELKKQLTVDSEENLQLLSEQCDAANIRIVHKTLKGKPGYAISHYAKEKKADLLVINSTDTQLNLLDRIFTHDIEFILADLPCNLMIVHSRIGNS